MVDKSFISTLNIGMNKNGLIMGGIITVVFGIPLLIFTHIFMSGGPDKNDLENNKFIQDTCGKEKFIKSIFTIGYIKASIRRFIADYKLLIFPQPQAELGKFAPDCNLVNLNGQSLSLLEDYIKKCPKGMPLILNMGSYT